MSAQDGGQDGVIYFCSFHDGFDSLMFYDKYKANGA